MFWGHLGQVIIHIIALKGGGVKLNNKFVTPWPGEIWAYYTGIISTLLLTNFEFNIIKQHA